MAGHPWPLGNEIRDPLQSRSLKLSLETITLGWICTAGYNFILCPFLISQIGSSFESLIRSQYKMLKSVLNKYTWVMDGGLLQI